MYEKLVVGRYLDLPKLDSSQGTDVVGGPLHFVSTPGRDYQIEMSEPSEKTGGEAGTRTSAVVAGQNPKPKKVHRNFRWLHWQPGKVTYLPLAGADILTGKMSGCWVVIFTMDDTKYVAHIGTHGSPITPPTLQVKAAWAAAVLAGTVTPIAAYRPNHHLVDHPILASESYGLVTSSREFHALRLDRKSPFDTLNQIGTMTAVPVFDAFPGDPGHANFV